MGSVVDVTGGVVVEVTGGTEVFTSVGVGLTVTTGDTAVGVGVTGLGVTLGAGFGVTWLLVGGVADETGAGTELEGCTTGVVVVVVVVPPTIGLFAMPVSVSPPHATSAKLPSAAVATNVLDAGRRLAERVVVGEEKNTAERVEER